MIEFNMFYKYSHKQSIVQLYYLFNRIQFYKYMYFHLIVYLQRISKRYRPYWNYFLYINSKLDDKNCILECLEQTKNAYLSKHNKALMQIIL